MTCDTGPQFDYAAEPCLPPFCVCGGCQCPGCVRRCRCERPRLVMERRQITLEIIDPPYVTDRTKWPRMDTNYATGEKRD